MITYDRTQSDVNESVSAMAGGDGRRLDNDLLPILAHEMYQPLQTILFAVEAAQQVYSDESDARQACDIAQHEAEFMSQIINDLLDVFCDVQGRVQLNVAPVELAAIVDAAVETTRASLATRGHRLSVSLPPEPVSFLADPWRLQQVLTNLLTNAAKHTGPGGHICLTADATDDEVVIRVRDNGKGISPDRLARIFDLYQPSIPGQRGLGLGLALVKSLVQMHGGDVAAHSQGPGLGSEFVVRLPAGGPDLGAPPVPFSLGNDATTNPTCLGAEHE
jgi:signal transduction histidine kinase